MIFNKIFQTQWRLLLSVNSGDRVIDVGSEWRTFSNDKATKDPSRVGDTQNPLLSDGDLSTMIGKVTLKIKFYQISMLLCQVCLYICRESIQRIYLHRDFVCKMWLFPAGSRKDLTSSAEGSFAVLWGYLPLLGMLL